MEWMIIIALIIIAVIVLLWFVPIGTIMSYGERFTAPYYEVAKRMPDPLAFLYTDTKCGPRAYDQMDRYLIGQLESQNWGTKRGF